MSDAMPTREQVSAWLGVRAPAPLMELIAAAYEFGQFPARAADALETLLGGELMVASERAWRRLESPPYEGTPRGFVPLVWTGVDGVQYGYLVRDGERDTGEWMVVEFSPMESPSVLLVGRDTREAVEALISEVLESVHEWGDPKPDPRLLALVCERLGIEPSREKAARRWGADGEGIAVDVEE
jgi:hypothetical protein